MDVKESYSYEVCELIQKGKLDKLKKLIANVGLSHSDSWQNGYTWLYWSLENDCTNIAKWLLSQNCQVNPENQKFTQKTALHLAVSAGKLKIVKTLLKKGAFVNVSNENLETPLHVVCKKQKNEMMRNRNEVLGIIKLLLKYGAPINEKGGLCKETPLLFAIKSKSQCMKLIKLLINNGADVNEYDMYRKTPLHIAVEYKDKKIVKFLIEHGANVNFKNCNGRSPLHIATRLRSIEIVKILLNNKADVNDIIHDFEECRWSALHIAVKNKDEKMIKLLLDNNANVNAIEGDHHRTPLHIGSISHSLEIVKILLSAGADVNEVDKQGQTPLHLAVRIEDEKMVELLLNNNSDIKAKRNDGKNPLHFAAENRFANIAKLLLLKGADIRDVTLDGRNVLHFAAKKGSKELVELFLKLGIDIDVKTKYDGFTPLYFAIKKNHYQIAEYLLYNGADVNITVKIYQTLLRLAVYDMNKDMVELLLNWNADINAEDNDDETPLFIATDCPRYEDIPGSEMMHGITDCLIMYIAKLVAQNKIVSEQNLNLIKKNYHLLGFYESCQKELSKMKDKKIHDNISYFDILTKNTNTVASYARNKSLTSTFESMKHTKSFPIYSIMMYKNYKRGKIKEKLIELGSGTLSFLFRSNKNSKQSELPYFVVRHVLEYLNIKDLRALTSVYQN